MIRSFAMVAALALAPAVAPAVAEAKAIAVGDPAPEFELTLIDGAKVPLSGLRGQVVVLNFWATWCGPCRTELPLLDRYYELNKRHGLSVFAITTQDSLPLSRLKTLFAAMKMPSARRIKGPYPILRGLPTNYVIDRAGVVRYAASGAFDLDTLNAVLVPLMREPVMP